MRRRDLLTAFYRDLSVIAQEPLARWVHLLERTNTIVAGRMPDRGNVSRRAGDRHARLSRHGVRRPADSSYQEILAGARLAHPMLELPPRHSPAMAGGTPRGPDAPAGTRFHDLRHHTKRRGLGRPSVMSPDTRQRPGGCASKNADRRRDRRRPRRHATMPRDTPRTAAISSTVRDSSTRIRRAAASVSGLMTLGRPRPRRLGLRVAEVVEEPSAGWGVGALRRGCRRRRAVPRWQLEHGVGELARSGEDLLT